MTEFLGELLLLRKQDFNALKEWFDGFWCYTVQFGHIDIARIFHVFQN